MKFSHPYIETLLQDHKTVIGVDYAKYRNHVYRVFLNCILIDSNKDNEDKYAIAAVYHDIGIWTDHTIDYLHPSIDQVKIYLNGIQQQDWIAEISQLIYWHHKTSAYTGSFEQTVETFRKADWIDVSVGLINYGYDKKTIRRNRKRLPNLGFHLFLLKKILKNFCRHPLQPLPMFKT